MRLVILARSLEFGGAERQLVALARGLHDRGHRVSVVLFYGGGPLERDLHEAGVPVVALGKRGRWDIGGFAWRLARALRRERPDIVHGYLAMPNLLALALRPIHGGKVVWGVRGSAVERSDQDWLERAIDRGEARLARRADLVIANSHAGKAAVVAQGFPAGRVRVVPNGIDTARFHPDPAAGQRFRAELGVPAEVPLVGAIGRLDPQKDHPTFLRAAAQIAAERGDVRFVCVGSGPPAEAARLRQLGDELGLGDRLRWVPARAEVTAVYNGLDVLALSSAYGEGFPNVVGEAMACGVPCAVTDVGDAAFVVGELGLVAPPRDPVRLAAAIGRLLDERDSGAERGAACRARIVEQFSLAALVDGTEDALRQVLPRRARS
ncbi:MAG: glycosyltransferase [Thermomicrobiales bacterium]|nr:glycosyltransferase [Thermomicrobiales bacterium]